MPGALGIAGVPYPLAGEIPDGPAALLGLAQKLVDITDPVPTIADLPATGNWVGRTKIVQALPNVEFQWTGAAWKLNGVLSFADNAAATTFVGIPAQLAALVIGTQAYIASIRQFKYWTGSAWSFLSQVVNVIPSGVTQASGASTIAPDGTITFAAAVNPKLLGIFDTALSDVYDIELNLLNGSNLQAQLLSGTTAAAGATDYGNNVQQSSAGTMAGANAQGNIAIIQNAGAALRSYGTIRITDPHAARTTSIKTDIETPTSSTQNIRNWCHSQHAPASQYDGLTITTATPLTGTFQIRAYAK